MQQLVHEGESCIQRAAEIVIVGPEGAGKKAFLQAFCSPIYGSDENVVVGSCQISSDLILYCYSVGYTHSFSWDLIGDKMLGYIAIFNWYDELSFAACRETVHFASSHFSAPLIVAADLGLKPLPVPESAVRPFIPLSPSAKFLFFQSHKPASIRKVVVTLIEVLLEKLE
jgi:ABC-type cobalamin/Fe3+-siderophores transport system ATPase subunit